MAVVFRGPTFRTVSTRSVQQPGVVANRLALTTIVVAVVGVGIPQENPVRNRIVQQPHISFNYLPLRTPVSVIPVIPVQQENPVRKAIGQHGAGSQSLALNYTLLLPTSKYAFPEIIIRKAADQDVGRSALALTVPVSALPAAGFVSEQPNRHVAPKQPKTVGNILPLTAVVPAPFAQNEWPNPAQFKYSFTGYNPASVALLSVPVSAPFSQAQWPNPLVVTYKSLHDDYLNNHWQIDYPLFVQPPVNDIGGGVRSGAVRRIKPRLPPELRTPIVPVVPEKKILALEEEQTKELEVTQTETTNAPRNPVLAQALLRAQATKQWKPVTLEKVITAMEAPLPVLHTAQLIVVSIEDDDEEILMLMKYVL